jgi:hypothetical protein
MKARMAVMMICGLGLLVSRVDAGGKADSKASVSFHIETEATDNPKMIFSQETNGQTRYFRRLPEINSKDVAAFRPCPSDSGGDDYGIVFQLKETAARRMAAITNANQGRWLLAQINGRVVDAVQIDKPIEDGFLVVWKGVTTADLNLFDEAYPRIGQKEKEKKKKKK